MTELLKFLVNDVKSKGVSCPLHLGDEVTDLLLSLDLFLEVLALQEVSQLGVVMTVGLLVELKQGLVDLLLQFEGGLDGSEGGSPLVGPGLGNVLEDDTPTPPVLVVDELLGVLAFLVRVLAKALGEAVQCNVIAIKVSSHGHVDVAGMELHVDLLVDQGFGVGVEVDADLGERHDDVQMSRKVLKKFRCCCCCD